MEARTENCCQQIIAEETKRRRHVTSETFDTNWKGCGQDMRSGSRPSESTDPSAPGLTRPPPVQRACHENRIVQADRGAPRGALAGSAGALVWPRYQDPFFT